MNTCSRTACSRPRKELEELNVHDSEDQIHSPQQTTPSLIAKRGRKYVALLGLGLFVQRLALALVSGLPVRALTLGIAVAHLATVGALSERT